MAGRGRGRGGGAMLSREISERMGMGTGPNGPEIQVDSVHEPPPLYPPLENRPVPLDLGVEGEYLLALKRDFVEHFHDSPSYIQYAVIKSDIQRYSDRYQTATLTSRTASDIVCDWRYFPHELKENSMKPLRKKRKAKGSHAPSKVIRKTEDLSVRLEELEKREEENSDVEGEGADGSKVENAEGKTKDKDADSEVEEEVEDEDMDEEMDDGTDYINNYFDNGEDYIDEEDDNLDDGPVY